MRLRRVRKQSQKTFSVLKIKGNTDKYETRNKSTLKRPKAPLFLLDYVTVNCKWLNHSPNKTYVYISLCVHVHTTCFKNVYRISSYPAFRETRNLFNRTFLKITFYQFYLLDKIFYFFRLKFHPPLSLSLSGKILTILHDTRPQLSSCWHV